MSSVRRKDPKVVAVLCSDIHLSNRPPIARSAEPDWFAAMERSIRYLAELAGKYEVPILCAGDVFDKWNSPPELINFALDTLPVLHAIPGQHDLPYHNHNLRHMSAYNTLVGCGKIVDLDASQRINNMYVHPAAWSRTLPPPCKVGLNVGVLHRYIWKKGSGFKGAPEEATVIGMSRTNEFNGYKALVFGDNHKGFLTHHTVGGNLVSFLNCGTFFRRTIDEINYCPHVGLLHNDGSIQLEYLPCDKDLFISNDDLNGLTEAANISNEFLQELESLGDGAIKFSDAVKNFITTHRRTVPRRVISILRNIIE